MALAVPCLQEHYFADIEQRKGKCTESTSDYENNSDDTVDKILISASNDKKKRKNFNHM